MLQGLRYWGGALVRHRLRRHANKFLSATSRPAETQEHVLKKLLKLNADSDFGRHHRLRKVRTPDDFRRQVPIHDYAALAPYIQRLKQGEHSALIGSKNPLLMFALTSGTTSSTKFIPITKKFLADYRRGWRIWGIRAFDDHPALHRQHMVQLSSDFDQFRTPSGIPCGNISGLVSAMQSPIVRSMYSVPPSVSKVKNHDAKFYTALRLAVPDRHVGVVLTANASTLIQLAQMADEHSESLIRDIHDGTLTHAGLDDDNRRALRFRIRRRNPRRAAELEAIVSRTGHLFPKDYWSNLNLLAVWTGGSAGAYLSGLPKYFGEVPIRDHGLSASEGRMTIPIRDGSSEGILDITSHFFEFIPVAEAADPQARTLLAHELQAGAEYFILLTTPSGLYRYNISDVVRCTGFYQKTPLLEFLHKGAHISNITGEKLSESQVATAVGESLGQLSLHLGRFTLVPVWGTPPQYQLLVEKRDISPVDRLRLAGAIESRLQQLNSEYCDKRGSGRLAAVSCMEIPDHTWERFARQRQSRPGGSIEQYKHPCLVPGLDFLDKFLQEFVNPYSATQQVNPPHFSTKPSTAHSENALLKPFRPADQD